MDINNILRDAGVIPSKIQTQNEGQANRKTEGSESFSAPLSAPTEKVTLTETTTRLQQVAQQAAKQPKVNSARVEQIRAALADGGYKVNPERIAARLMAFEIALRG